MDVDTETIQDQCTDAVFERGQNHRREDRIQRIERFDDFVTAKVQGSNLYDVTVELNRDAIDTGCTCPYGGPGDCKHLVAVLLELVKDPPSDESERIRAILDDVSADALREFIRDALATHPDLRDHVFAQFGDAYTSVEEYREEIDQLFEQHADPTVSTAIDFSRYFEIAKQYRDRDRYLAAATVYQAVFEAVDENVTRIDGAYDHYAQTLTRTLDGYVDSVLATDPSSEKFDRYAGVLEVQVLTDPPISDEQFRRALDDLEDRYDP